MLCLDKRISGSVEVFFVSDRGGVPDTSKPMAGCVAKLLAAGFGAEFLLADYWNANSPVSDSTINEMAEICAGADLLTIHTCVFKWAPDELRKEILTAVRLGVKQIVIHPYALGLDIQGCNPSRTEVRDLCKYALDNGVRLAVENLGKTGIISIRRALDIVGSDPDTTGLGVCVDTGHAYRSCAIDGIPPIAFIEEFRDQIIELHIDDNFGDEDLHLPPGEGSIDWPPILDAISHLRPDTVICLEIRSNGDPIETIRASRDFLLATSIVNS